MHITATIYDLRWDLSHSSYNRLRSAGKTTSTYFQFPNMAVTQLIALIRQARLAVANSGGLKTPPTPQLLTIINIHTKCLLFIYSHETGKYRHFESLKTENTISYKNLFVAAIKLKLHAIY